MKLGYDESGGGPVLLLVHGFPINRHIWAEQLDGLADIRRVVAVDLRGRGRSPVDDYSWSIDDHADDLAETIEAIGADRVDLAGISMGGYIAFSFWRRHPQMLRCLILLSTRAAEDPPEYKTGRAMTAERARKYGTAALAGSMLPNLVDAQAPPQIRDRVSAIFEEVPGETSAADSLAMMDRADSTADLPSISVPTLVIEGQGDHLLPEGSGRALADAIPGAELVRIPAAGHFAPIENPEAVNAAIREFLGGSRAR